MLPCASTSDEIRIGWIILSRWASSWKNRPSDSQGSGAVASIPTAPTNHPFSHQQLSDLSRRQKAAIRASRVAPMARKNESLRCSAKVGISRPRTAMHWLLANVYLHYAFDLWVQHWRQQRATGEMIVVRYADDAVLGFQHHADVEQFFRDWKERLGRFGLELHPDTTDRVRALRSRKPKRTWRREAGDVHLPMEELGKWLRSVVQGYFNYHAVPGNLASLRSFRLQVIRRWMRGLRRRSQESRVTRPRLVALAQHWLPQPSILHPYPNLRFDARHPR